MASRGKNQLDFTVNVDFAAKASKDLNTYVQDLTQLKKLFGERLAGNFIDDSIKKLNQGRKTVDNFIKTINNSKLSKQERFEIIPNTANDLKQLTKLMRGLDKVWMNEALKNNSKVLAQLDEIRNKQKTLSSVKGNITKNQNSMSQIEKELRDTGYTGGTTASDAKSLQVKLNKNKKVIGSAGNFDNKDLEEENKLLEKQITLIDKLVKGRKRNAEYNKQVSSLSAIDGKSGTTDVDAASKRLNAKEATLMSQSENPENLEKINQGFKEVAENAAESVASMNKFGETAEMEFEKAQKEAQQTAEATQTLKQVLAQFGIGISAVSIVNYFKDLTKAAFEFYQSLDTALNQIYVVSGLTSNAVMNLKDDFIQMSKDSGMAIDDIAQSAVLFYQQGLDTSAVLEMTEVTAQFAKVAGIDATDAADKLTAAVNGYCLSASDASLVADKFNQVAAASAADIDELSTAFSKAAAQANQAGVSMDNYLAYIATMEEATREAPENIGTSLKTIFSRMDQIKNAGSSEDGETDVNQVETALKSVGVQLRDSENQLRNLEDVLDELGGKWNSLDVNTQAYLGTIIAGTRQQSRFITLMQNWDRVLELSEESENSAGMQALMHEKAMDSLATSVQRMTNAWQTFLSNLTESDTIRNLVDLLTNLLNKINSGAKPITLLGMGVVLLSKQFSKFDGVLKKGQKGISRYLRDIARFPKSLSKVAKGQKGLTKDQLKAAKSYRDLSGKLKDYNGQLKDLKKKQKECDPNSEAYKEYGQEISKVDGEIKNVKNSMSQANKTMGENKDQALEAADAENQFDKSVTAAATALAGLSVVLPGVAGNLAGAMSGVVTMIGGFSKMGGIVSKFKEGYSAFSATFRAQSTANGVTFQGACKAIKAGLDSIGIGELITILQILFAVIGGGITLVKNLVEIFGKQDEKLADSVNAVSDALDSYNTVATELNAAKKMMKTYDELSGKIYKTTEDQEKLNKVTQDLADAFDLETVEDPYGNITISATALADAMKQLEQKAKEAREELIKTEDEEAEKWDGTRKRREKFYNTYLGKNKATITKGMTDIDINIDEKKLKTSADKINELTATLQSNIVDYTKTIGGSFKDGLTATEYIDNMMASINDAVDDDSWNQLFGEVENLSKDIDNLTYAEVSDQLDQFFENWAKDLGLTQAEIEAVRASLEGTLYAGSNLNKTIGGYQDKLDKNGGEYYTKQIEDLKKQREEAKKNSGTFWNPFAKDDYEKQYEQLGRQIDNLTDDMMNNVNQLSEAEKAEYQSMIDVLGNLTNATAAAMDQADMFSDLVNSDGETIMSSEELLSKLDLTGINAAFKESGNKGAEKLMQELQKQIASTDSTELKVALQEKLDKIVDGLSLTPSISWGQLHDNLDKASEDLRSMNKIMEEFEENGGISLDTFSDLCDILDNINLADVFDAGMMDEYLTALDQLNLGFDASSGYITAEGDALESLQTIQEAATKAEIQATINKLETRKASLQSQLAMVEAEMATNQALINHLANSTDTEISLNELSTVADVSYTKNKATATQKISGYYEAMTNDSSKWAEASIENAANVGEAFDKLASGELNKSTAQSYLNGLMKDMKFEGLGASDVEGLDTDGDGKVARDAAIKKLQDYNQQLNNTYSYIQSQIKMIDGQIGLLNKLKEADLGKFGAEGKDKDNKSIDRYIGKLKEIYNILNKIETTEHRLSTLETYASSARGKDYANNLQERIKLNKSLMSSYDDLMKQQKDLVASERKAIEDSPVGQVFTFDKYGTIQIDYEKYLALQDEAADGEQTLKELADNLYDEYTALYKEQQDYFDQKIAYLEKTIELEQEQVDKYVDLQHDLADAVKEIYQKMLDNRLEAIDKEMDALDKLKESYEEASQARSDSKEISKMQTGLKRSMMDTSGASNTKVLSYQDQLQEKLESMGEDQYTKRLDGITEALQNEQDQLQEEFDKYFENYDALYKMIDQRILGNEDAVMEVLKTTDEWQTATEAERTQMLSQWQTNYATAMSGLGGGATIMDVVQNIFDLQDSVYDLDKTMQQNGDPSRIGKEISTALIEYYQSFEKDGDSGGSKKKSSGGGGGGGVKANSSLSTADLSDYSTGLSPEELDVVKSKLEGIAGWWNGVKTNISSWWTNAWSAVSSFFTKTLPEWWSEHVNQPIVGFFTETIPNFFTQTIPGWFSGLKDIITNWWSENISPLFTLEYWQEKIGNIIYNVSYGLTEIWLDIQDWWNAKIAKFFTAEYWKKKWDDICNFFSNGWDGIVSFFTEAIPNWLAGVKDNISAWWEENIAPVFTAEFWKEKWEGVKEGFSNGWNSLVEFFTSTIPQWWNDHVAKFFTVEYWKEKLNNILTSIQNWWSGVKSWFSSTIGAWWDNNIAKFFTKEFWVNKFNAVKDGFVAGVKNTFNAIIDIFNGVIDKIGGFFSWLGKGISKVTEWLTGKTSSGANDAKANHISKFETGGLADFTGPAWLDGTKSAPEAVLNAAQTKAFMKLANNLDKVDTNGLIPGSTSSVNIESIEFRVDSMSSVEDGEIAFDAFVQKFKEIGSQKGLYING